MQRLNFVVNTKLNGNEIFLSVGQQSADQI